MSLPYATAPHAWRFVILIHRLAGLDPESSLRISPAKSSSINTTRAKVFQGRTLILSTHDPALAIYSPLALATVIHTFDARLELSRGPNFDQLYGDLKFDTFSLVYKSANAELMKFTKTFTMPFGDATLTSPQMKALKDFLSNAPNVKYVNITPNSLIVAR